MIESKQLFIAHYDHAIEGGNYKLVVESRAGLGLSDPSVYVAVYMPREAIDD